jgi:hypothetical protein
MIQFTSPIASSAPSKDPDLAAISAIETNEGLSGDEMIDACDAIVRTPGFGRTYLALQKPNMRTQFLRMALDKYRAQRSHA